jgi:D-3-phosphoglycerate dehydrogenase
MMADLRVLISCQHVWKDEEEVGARLAEHSIAFDMPRYEGQQLEEDDLLPILANYDGILAGDDHLTRGVLESAPRLKVISKWGIGIDAIDLDAASELGVTVLNTPGVFGDELADYAMGYIHLMARRQHTVNERVKSGEWHKVTGSSLAGRTLGIVGLGSSGRALVGRALASGMNVVGYDVVDVGSLRGCEIVGLDELLTMSDIISLHVPATEQTHHLVDAEFLTVAKQGVWLVNTSRGALVDESALAAALARGDVGAAALDVFETEPVSPDNPLLGFDNVVVGSHNGSNTAEAVERTTWLAVDNLIKGLGL